MGGAPYLASLIATVPTAANTAYYARIVRERATMRRLVEAGTRVTQLGYAADGGDVDELVNLAQAEIYAVSERNSSDDYVRVGDILDDANLEIEAAQNRDNKGMRGVPTGFIELDELTGGLQAGQMVIIAGRRPWVSPRWPWIFAVRRRFATRLRPAISHWKWDAWKS